jgi:hypothetical protein
MPGRYDTIARLSSGFSLCASRGRMPLWAKLGLAAYVGVLLPFYLHTYGPLNLLWFCDMALLITLIAVWTDCALLASMQAVSILIPQTIWIIGLLFHLATGVSPFGMTTYMFHQVIPLHVRLLSLYHAWLPFFLLWTLWRLGYDRRGFPLQVVVGITVLLVAYFFTPPPPAPPDNPAAPVNIDAVFGLSLKEPQHWMNPNLYFVALILAYLLVFWLPTHLLLSWLMPPACEPAKEAEESAKSRAPSEADASTSPADRGLADQRDAGPGKP